MIYIDRAFLKDQIKEAQRKHNSHLGFSYSWTLRHYNEQLEISMYAVTSDLLKELFND